MPLVFVSRCICSSLTAHDRAHVIPSDRTCFLYCSRRRNARIESRARWSCNIFSDKAGQQRRKLSDSRSRAPRADSALAAAANCWVYLAATTEPHVKWLNFNAVFLRDRKSHARACLVHCAAHAYAARRQSESGLRLHARYPFIWREPSRALSAIGRAD